VEKRELKREEASDISMLDGEVGGEEESSSKFEVEMGGGVDDMMPGWGGGGC